ncbi:aminoglycoside phosphotransferase (APT) family kinase protein [Sphingopyxis panaciterrae]|uniref:phosphotransferase n=1 Tax=Sphingopyxis panaciterrae TaxID=363841 RepID=UPI00142020DF|nr:phosphotransferase [Sphingopyxis panaciterrae]NIJ37974.1 aminoglycoside phosphotransferase (APT) family kinase protein [Sphingopyxis panaciterrae]
MTDLTEPLSAFMTRVAGPGALIGLARLSGGANMESWAFDWAGAGGSDAYVLRRAPSAEFMEGRPYGHADEAALVMAAHGAGVKAPEVVGVLADGDGMGTGYVMRRVIAEVNPAKILAAPPPSLIADLGRELAHIHAVPAETIPAAIPQMDTAAALAELKARFLSYGGDRPAIALAIKWCEDHLPVPADPVLVHGDYRMGNIMADGDGLAVVLDWELAHRGDAHEDLAFGCMTVWRFGQLDKPAFGVGSLEDYFAAYEAAGGAPVDRTRFHFWLVYRTLWWALGCLQMGQAWRSGADTTVERVVIGRRTAEQELDLLLLLEAQAPEAERMRALPPSPPALPQAVGEPATREMVQAVRDWLNDAIKPAAEGHHKFQVAVAMNALGIAMRDLDANVRAEDKTLAGALLSGTKTLADPGLLAALRRAALAKLAVDSPKYAALAHARALWGG